MSSTSEEDRIVAEHFRPLAAGFPGAFGLTDDCAVIAVPPGHELVVKTDPVAAGVHFLADDDPADIAWKALAVNVSDLAAKGALPIAYVMALSFPDQPTDDWLARFAEGLGQAQSAFGMHLAGGDTDRRPGPISISITAFGSVPAGRMVRRGTARPGDRVYVTGTIGDAWLGLGARTGAGPTLAGLSDEQRAHVLSRYARPEPRLALRPALGACASAAMDISDGLVKDLGRMAHASGVAATIWLAEIPLSSAAVDLVRTDPALLLRLATAGDDYELLVTVAEAQITAFEREAAAAGRITCIGEIGTGAGVTVHDVDGRPMAITRTGYEHF